MEHRHDVEDPVVLGDAEEIGGRLGEAVQEHRAMGVDDALGMPGGTGRVAHAGRIALGERRPLTHRLRACEQRFVLEALRPDRRRRVRDAVGHDHESPYRRQLVADVRDHGPEARIDEDDRVARVIDDVGQVRRRETDVEGMENRAGERRRPVDLEMAMAVPRERRHAIAAADAEARQGAGEPHRALGEIAVGIAKHRSARHARGDPLAGEESPATLEEVRQGERVVHHEVVETRGHCPRPPGATSPRSSDVAQRKPTKWCPAAAPRRS